MTSRCAIRFAVIAICLATGAATLLTRTSEPAYKGRTLTAWLKDLLDPGKRSSAQTTRAVQAMGTDALPRLMQMFERKNSRLRSLLFRLSAADWINRSWPPAEHDHFLAAAGFNMLGTNAAPALPRLRQLMANGEGADQVRVLDVMRFLGPAATGDIAAALSNRDPALRIAAICALSTNQFSAGALVALLEPRTKDSEVQVRTVLYTWLRRRQLPPGQSLPILEQGFNDLDPEPRATACEIVGLMGPAAGRLLPELEQLAANDTSLTVRQTAQAAVERIKGDEARPGTTPRGTH